jgi:superfamily II DNA or RNA helicase
MTELRPYQSVVVAEFERTIEAGQKRIILVAPTGSGKTVIAAEIIKRAVARHQSVLVLSHRREIITLTSRKLYDHGGISHGIVQSGFSPRPLESVQVASVQTLWVRAIRSDAMPLPPANLLIIDEAHHCPAGTYAKIIAAYPDAVLLSKTVAFACSVAHSIHIRDEFVRAGVRAEHIDGSTPKDQRDGILARLEAGELELVSNCMVLTEGWDMPEVGCCILARPTRKMGLFRQMVGRVLRPADGKRDAVILDHSGAVFKHGLPEDPVEWSLDPARRAESPAHQKRLRREAARLIECTKCSALRMGGLPCPACGFLPQRPAQYIAHADGDLALVKSGRKAGAVIYDPAERERWHGMLTHIAAERGYQRGWISHKFKEKFGAWPAWGSAPQPIEPTPEVRSWVRSRQIAFAKSRSVA